MNNLNFTVTTMGNKGSYNYQIVENGASSRSEKILNGKSGSFSEAVSFVITIQNGEAKVVINGG